MFAPLTDQDWPREIEDMQSGFAGRLNVYRTMAHHPALLRSWTDFRNHVVLTSVLGAQLSEVVILRTGVRLGSNYEWSHHVYRGRKVGLSDARILSIRGPVAQMEPQDAILAQAVDELFDHHRLSTQSLEAIATTLGNKAIFDVMATVAHYQMLGFMLNSFDVPLDGDVAADLAASPIE